MKMFDHITELTEDEECFVCILIDEVELNFQGLKLTPDVGSYNTSHLVSDDDIVNQYYYGTSTIPYKQRCGWILGFRKETYVLVKASFYLNITSDCTSYEIPFGSIKRTNLHTTAYEKAKWEVPSLRWADITENNDNYGVSLLNDCKYGYDSEHDLLRLTLLKSPQWPDPNCDKGIHQFSVESYRFSKTTMLQFVTRVHHVYRTS